MSDFGGNDFTSALKRMEQNGQTGAGITERELKIVVWFVPQAIRDEVASQREGRNIYKETVYMGRRNVGDKDYITTPTTPDILAQYPQEWAEYQARMRNPKTSMLHFPGADWHPAILRYCEDARLFTIEDLAEAETVQPELVEVQALARRWVAMVNAKAEPVAVKKRGGRVKGSKNKPKVPSHVQDAEAAA